MWGLVLKTAPPTKVNCLPSVSPGGKQTFVDISLGKGTQGYTENILTPGVVAHTSYFIQHSEV